MDPAAFWELQKGASFSQGRPHAFLWALRGAWALSPFPGHSPERKARSPRGELA